VRPVVLYTLLSLDGVAEAPDRWLFEFDDLLDQNLGEVIGEQDAVLLGRQMYDEWSVHWPLSDLQPFAPFINAVQKYVVTSRPLAADWRRTTVVDRPVEEFVAELRESDGRAIGVHGSITLAQSLLRAGLIDELRFVIAPTTAGAGRRLFDGAAPPQRWTLVESLHARSGALVLHYRH
jgi:dihydrofolate reductase